MVMLQPNFLWTTNLIPLLVPRLQVDLTLPPVPEARGVAQGVAEESLEPSSLLLRCTGPHNRFQCPPVCCPVLQKLYS